MRYDQFWEVLFNSSNSIHYIYIYILMVFFIVISFKNFFITKLDPLLVTLISQCSLIFIISLLFYEKRIEKIIFLELLSISVVFLVSLRFFLGLKKQYIFNSNPIKLRFKDFYKAHTLVFLFVSVISFHHLIGGIAFKEKLIAYAGKGILNYFVAIMIPGQVILIMIKRNLHHVKKKETLFIFFLQL